MTGAPVRLAVVHDEAASPETAVRRAMHALASPDTSSLRGDDGAWFTATPAGPGQVAVLFPSEGIRAAPSVARLVRDAAASAQVSWQALKRAGIQPTLAAGHSAGELAAVVALRLLDLDPARFVDIGAEVDIHEGGPRALLSVLGAPGESLQALLQARPTLFLCADDSPRHQLLGGELAVIREAARRLSDDGAVCRELPWPVSAHTPLFRRTAAALDALFATVETGRPEASLFSSSGARPFPWEDPAATRALLRDQWLKPVRFRETTEALFAAGGRAFIELPGRQGLAGYVTDTLGERPHLSLCLPAAGPVELANLAANLWINHFPVDVSCWQTPRPG